MKEQRVTMGKGAFVVRLFPPEIQPYRTRYAYEVQVEGNDKIAKTGIVYAGYKHRYQITRYGHDEGIGTIPSVGVLLEVERALGALVEAYGADAAERERGLARARFLRSRVITNRRTLASLQEGIDRDLAELKDLPDPYPSHPLDED